MLGYEKSLFILAFDHRSSIVKKFFGSEKADLDLGQVQKFIEIKKIIYQGFKKALTAGIPQDQAAILIDEEFGDPVLREAKKEGFIFALAVEKSGQSEFDFEYGEKFAEHIEKYHPSFVKALVRYNPEENYNLNLRQKEKLKILNDFCKSQDYKFLLELLVPATEIQLIKLDNNLARYNNEVRPRLTLQIIKEFQDFGLEPDIWKIEGMEKQSDYENMVKQIRSDNREDIGMVILGRGENKTQVEKWLLAGKGIEGIIGFAIGRTIFQEPILNFLQGKITPDQAVEKIRKNYQYFYKLFTS